MSSNSVSPGSQNGWNEYSRLVLKELETLSKGITSLNSEIQEIKKEIALIKDREDKVEELRAWKEKIDDVMSPTQLKDVIKDIHDLKSFKTTAVTAFIVIQFIVALIQIFFKNKFFGF